MTLSKQKKDALGMPLSKIDWKISEAERQTARRMTQLVCQEFARLGLPAPTLNPWLDDSAAWMSNCVEKASSNRYNPYVRRPETRRGGSELPGPRCRWPVCFR